MVKNDPKMTQNGLKGPKMTKRLGVRPEEIRIDLLRVIGVRIYTAMQTLLPCSDSDPIIEASPTKCGGLEHPPTHCALQYVM